MDENRNFTLSTNRTDKESPSKNSYEVGKGIRLVCVGPNYL
jgi:hypothetical protein